MGKLSKEELIELVKKIRNGEFEDEKERTILLERFRENVPHPEVINLMYYHKPRLTPEEIVEKALSYKPIILPSPDEYQSH